jgi:hypothetical protein
MRVAPQVGAVLEGERATALKHMSVAAARTVAAATTQEFAEVAGGVVAGAVRHAAQAYALMLRATPRASAHGGKAVKAMECGAVPCVQVSGSCPFECGARSVEVPEPVPAPERGAS